MLEDGEQWDLSLQYPISLQTEDKKDQEAWPCGFIAKFAFSDEFTYVRSTDKSLSVLINDSDIAHSVDRDKKFLLN